MTPRASLSGGLDLHALEARIQAIGRELFAAARREHAHLSVLNRWTAQVLSWCLSDPELKADILRFIDVLPSLKTPREIARHVREYFPASVKLPPALRLGSHLAHPGLLTHGALAAVIRQLIEQVARQFIAEHHPEGAARVIRALAAQGASCSLDILGEQVLSDPEADRYVAQCVELLRESAAADAARPTGRSPITCGPRANVSVKPSALSPRFDPISPTQSLERATRRLLPLLHLAVERDALVNLDMEHSELRDLTLELAKQLLLHSQVGSRLRLGIVIQAYLRDSESVLEELLEWLAAHERTITIRLVKGAYWDSELAQARQCQWPVPVYQEKAETDAAFERLTRRLLSAAPRATTAIASHNLRAIAHAMAFAEALGLAKDQLEFQLLYGMGEAIQGAIVSLGYPVRVYTPIGELIPGMAYLVRRLLENTANESFLRRDWVQEQSADELLRLPTVAEASVSGARSGATPGWIGEPLADFAKAPARARMVEALTLVHTKLGEAYPLLVGPDKIRTAQRLSVCNPARPDEVVGAVARATLADVNRAVHTAREAQVTWAKTPAQERVACVRRAATLMRERRSELAAWEVLEVGKTWREADVDVVEAIDHLEYYSQSMMAFADGKPLLQLPGERNLYTYRPRGVAVVIAPWNFPSAILMGMASAALVSGNAVILKPAEQSSVIAAHLAHLCRAAGVPPGVLQYLPGLGEEVGAALVQHPGTDVVLFTGSKAVGLSILEACAKVAPGQRQVKHVVAEMGGKNAIIVDADADLDAAVSGILRSAFSYGGQKCSAASRVIVHEAVYDRLLSRLVDATDRLVVGDPADPGTDLGPLIEASAKRRLLEAMARAARVGRMAYRYPDAHLPRAGHFVGPAIAVEIPPRDLLATEELFGPLLCVFRVANVEEALALANDTDYALTGGVYSRSPAHIAQAMRAFDVGNLYVNRPITGAMVGRQPFGGHRLSGLGVKAGGPDYLLHLLLPQTICTNTARHDIPIE
ncbi:MAG: bifunctional proline dehydrogenase/L-glutamate gamma-semialdehyde dehydrogenase [Candidatus Omnitrophica bacterium]|nr:bifunctional proline dehydrogenase/L-glutamate gamma-semialdehyde dehydrogenase [Candidatus Omnitrophota bacterium]